MISAGRRFFIAGAAPQTRDHGACVANTGQPCANASSAAVGLSVPHPASCCHVARASRPRGASGVTGVGGAASRGATAVDESPVAQTGQTGHVAGTCGVGGGQTVAVVATVVATTVGTAADVEGGGLPRSASVAQLASIAAAVNEITRVAFDQREDDGV